jgi:hypothetical protein
MSTILLCTLNAKYIHTSFGLRYLLANMGKLRSQTQMLEWTIHDNPLQIVEEILQYNPRIVGFGIYIWNVLESKGVLEILRQVAPEVWIVLGGPEVSYEYQEQSIVQLSDYVITQEGEISFPKLCHQLINSTKTHPKPAQIIFGELPNVLDLCLPYEYYSAEDLAHRVLYVEASRGCPFKCQFCLSALDKKVRDFDLKTLLEAFERLLERGARHFKFVDRTFNLKVRISTAIMQFFLDKMAQYEDIFLHFEMIPDRFPEELQGYVCQFPVGQIQFEIGIQTFNIDVATRIQRCQNYDALRRNLQFLQKTGVHLHTDLIIGLPGEDITSFANGFDQLIALGVEEIQVGILKRLRGAPIIAQTKEFQQIYSPSPPYEILSNSVISYQEMQRLRRFARYWNIIGNSGRFAKTLEHFVNMKSPFLGFLHLCDWLFELCQRTNKISYNNMLQYLQRYFKETHKIDITDDLCLDYQKCTGKNHRPRFLESTVVTKSERKQKASSRQQRHIQKDSIQ